MPKGNPKGNPGNKGGGRKGAYVELKNAERLQAIWTTPGLIEELQARVRNKTASFADALGWDVRAGRFLVDADGAVLVMKDAVPFEPIEDRALDL